MIASVSEEFAHALRTLRACRTHLSRARNMHANTPELDRLALLHLQALAAIEEDLKATLTIAISFDSERQRSREARLRAGAA